MSIIGYQERLRPIPADNPWEQLKHERLEDSVQWENKAFRRREDIENTSLSLRVLVKGAAKKSDYRQLESKLTMYRSELDALPKQSDDGGATSDPATVNAAINFVRHCVHLMWARGHQDAPVPRVRPGPDGSVDVHWKSPKFEALVNIQPGASHYDFYCDDVGRTQNCVSGRLDATQPNIESILGFLLNDDR